VPENCRSAPIYLQNASILIWYPPSCRLLSASSQRFVIHLTTFVSTRQFYCPDWTQNQHTGIQLVVHAAEVHRRETPCLC
jgi:hypothetical protein